MVGHVLVGTDIPYEDGRHITYVNTAVDDGSEIANLMSYFKTADPYDMSHGDLSKRVHFLKCEEGGFDLMCNVTDRFIQLGREAGLKEGHETGLKSALLKGKKETAINLAAMGMTLDLIAKAVGETCPVVKQWLESA